MTVRETLVFEGRTTYWTGSSGSYAERADSSFVFPPPRSPFITATGGAVCPEIVDNDDYDYEIASCLAAIQFALLINQAILHENDHPGVDLFSDVEINQALISPDLHEIQDMHEVVQTAERIKLFPPEVIHPHEPSHTCTRGYAHPSKNRYPETAETYTFSKGNIMVQ